MALQRLTLGEVTVPYRFEKQGEGLGTDEVRGDDLMFRTDWDIAGHEA
jgi:hypothetical protein